VFLSALIYGRFGCGDRFVFLFGDKAAGAFEFSFFYIAVPLGGDFARVDYSVEVSPLFAVIVFYPSGIVCPSSVT